MDICSQNAGNIEIKVCDFKRKCRYHKKKGEDYLPNQLIPSGFCPSAFFNAYSLALSLLYNATDMKQKIYCPSYKNYIAIQINKIPLDTLMDIILNTLRKILCNFYPVDIIKSRIIMEVIESENCPRGYKIGDRFEFNIGNKKEVCPAIFNATYPYLKLFNHIGRLPWEISRLRCPDNKADIVLEVAKVK